MRKYLRSIGAIAVTFLLFGCASISYEPVKLDSSPLALTMIEECSEQKLSDSKGCVVLVQASLWASSTGINVKSDKNYCIQVPRNQLWFDATRRNTPPFGETGNWLMQQATMRHPENGFFSLIVNTRNETDDALSKGQAVEVEPLYRPDREGELVFYPNDAEGSVFDPAFFYRNNSGQIWVNVRQCEDGCDCPKAERQY